MTTSKTETRFQSQIRSFNKMYKLDCEDSPKLVVQNENYIEAAAQLLAEGKTIGWFQLGSEFGPRALGPAEYSC